MRISDFNTLIPQIKLYGDPEISISLKGDSERYMLQTTIQEENQKIQFDAQSYAIDKTPNYVFNLSMKNFNGFSWTQNPKYKSDLSANLHIKSNSLDPKEAILSLNGQCADSTFDKYLLKHISINSTKDKDLIIGSLITKSSYGNQKLSFTIKDLFAQPSYNINSLYENINLQVIPGIDSIYSNLNGNISIRGKGFSLKEMQTILNINSKNSSIIKYPISDLQIEFEYNRGNYNIKGLGFETPYFSLVANAHGNLYQENHINFQFEPQDINPLIKDFTTSNINSKGIIEGVISGNSDNLEANIQLNMEHAMYDSIHCGPFDGHINLSLSKNNYNGNILLNVNELSYNKLETKLLNFKSNFANDTLYANIDLIINDSLNTSFAGSLVNYKNPKILVDLFNINYNKTSWSNQSDSTYLQLNPHEIYVHQIHLKSNQQSIKVNGNLSFDGNEDLEINIQNFNIGDIPYPLLKERYLSGNLSSAISLKGTAQYPNINSEITISGLKINNYNIDNFTSKIEYKSNLLSYSGLIERNNLQPIKTNLLLPLSLSLTDSIYLLKDQNSFFASINIDSLNLNSLHQISPLRNTMIKGYAFANMRATNSINKPQIDGTFLINKGQFINSDYGIDYKEIELNALVKQKIITLNNLSAQTPPKGKIKLEGFINLEDSVHSNTEQILLKLNSTDFQIIKSTIADVNLNANLKLSGISHGIKD